MNGWVIALIGVLSLLALGCLALSIWSSIYVATNAKVTADTGSGSNECTGPLPDNCVQIGVADPSICKVEKYTEDNNGVKMNMMTLTRDGKVYQCELPPNDSNQPNVTTSNTTNENVQNTGGSTVDNQITVNDNNEGGSFSNTIT